MRFIIAFAAAIAFASVGTAAPAEAKRGFRSKATTGAVAAGAAAVRVNRAHSKSLEQDKDEDGETPVVQRRAPVAIAAPIQIVTEPVAPLKVNDIVCVAGCYK